MSEISTHQALVGGALDAVSVEPGVSGLTDATTARDTRSGPRRVTVNFPEKVYEMLESLAERTGKTMTEILRDAIALEKWVEEEQAKGGRIIAKRENGDQRELVIR